MNIKYVFSLFLLAFFSLNAISGFDAEIVSVDGRGSFSNDVLLIGNCNEPTKSQNVYLTIDITYPVDDCNGQIEVFYSYYDFPSESYTQEQQLCLMASDKACRGLHMINLGGTGEDRIDVDEYVRLRAVCKSNSLEFEKTLPISINHFPINGEMDALNKISEVDSILYDAELILNDCSACNPKLYSDAKAKLDSIKKQISNCDFTSYVARVTEVKEEAQVLKMSYEKTASSYEQPVDNIEEVKDKVEDVKEQIENVSNEMDNSVKETLEDLPVKTPSNGFCMVGMLLLSFLVYGFYLSKN